MKPFKLTASPGNENEKILPSIKITHGNTNYAALWSDGQITFNTSLDYYIEEIEYFVSLSKMWTTLFNNIKTDTDD